MGSLGINISQAGKPALSTSFRPSGCAFPAAFRYVPFPHPFGTVAVPRFGGCVRSRAGGPVAMLHGDSPRPWASSEGLPVTSLHGRLRSARLQDDQTGKEGFGCGASSPVFRTVFLVMSGRDMALEDNVKYTGKERSKRMFCLRVYHLQIYSIT